ncbi:MAG: hypothetical protein ABIG96_01640 [Candidatus Micrarchaeota archaeon]
MVEKEKLLRALGYFGNIYSGSIGLGVIYLILLFIIQFLPAYNSVFIYNVISTINKALLLLIFLISIYLPIKILKDEKDRFVTYATIFIYTFCSMLISFLLYYLSLIDSRNHLLEWLGLFSLFVLSANPGGMLLTLNSNLCTFSMPLQGWGVGQCIDSGISYPYDYHIIEFLFANLIAGIMALALLVLLMRYPILEKIDGLKEILKQNKKGIALVIICLFLVAAIAFYSSLPVRNPNLVFSTSRCVNFNEESPTDYLILNQSNLNVSWKNQTTLVIEGIIVTHCGGDKITGDYSVDGNEITLKSKVEMGAIVTGCICPHKVTYELLNLEKKDYSISVISDFPRN